MEQRNMAGYYAYKAPLHIQEKEFAVGVTPAFRRRNWTPFALRLPFLVSIIVVLQSCTIGLEVLLRRSAPLPPELSASVQRRQVATTMSPQTSMTGPGDYGLLTSNTSTIASTTLLTLSIVTDDYGSLTSADCGTIYVEATEHLTVTVSNVRRQPASSACNPTTITLTTTQVESATKPYGSLAAASSSTYKSTTPMATSDDYGSLTSFSSSESMSSSTSESILSSMTTDGYSIFTSLSSSGLMTSSTDDYGLLTSFSSSQSTSSLTSSLVPPVSSEIDNYGPLTSPTSSDSTSSFTSSFNVPVSSVTDNYGSLTSLSSTESTSSSTSESTLPVATSDDYGLLTSLLPSESISSSTSYLVVSSAAASLYGSLVATTSLGVTSSFLSSYALLTSSDPTSSEQITAQSAAPTSQYGSFTAESTLIVTSYSTLAKVTTSRETATVTIVRTLSDTETKTSTSNPTHTLSADVLGSLHQNDLMVNGTFTPVWYVTALYTPSIIAVLIKEAWSMIGSSTKLMQPFWRLSRLGGATAAESLCSQYLASTMSWNSIRNALTGDFYLLLIIMVNLVMSMLAPLATESMTVRFVGEGVNAQGNHFRQDPRWLVSPPLVRGLQAVLSFVSICIAVVIVLSLRRRSGLSANPSSIASMATLLNDQDVVRDINKLNPDLSTTSTAETLANRRYALVEYVSENGHSRHGLLKIGGSDSQETGRLVSHTMTVQRKPVAPHDLDESDLRHAKRDTLSKVTDFLLIFLLVSLLAVTIGYRFDSSDSGFNRFFNSEGFGPRFALSAAASFITLGMQNIEQEVRLKAPHRRLAKRYAPANSTILRNVNGTALTNLFSCLRHQDWFGFFVGLTALLGNVLIIAVVGVPYSSAAILQAFYTSVYVTCITCVLMLMVVIWTFVWHRHNTKLGVPHKPNDVLIRVLSGLCNDGNRVRAMFDGLDDTSERGLKRHCRHYDRVYYAGWMMDSYGRLRWCIEREGEVSLMS